MDLALYARVLWRHKLVVAGGVLVSLVLAFASIARVSPDGVHYRQKAIWKSEVTLFVTQKGFPWGSAVQSYLPSEPGSGLPARTSAEQSRMTSLAVLYAHLAASDLVRSLVAKQGPFNPDDIIQGYPVIDAESGTQLPLFTVRGLGYSSYEASSLAKRASDALREYLVEQQARSTIPKEERVDLQVLDGPSDAVVFSGRSKTKAMFVFVTGMLALIGLVFVLENLRPRVRAVPDEQPVATARSA